MKKTLPVTITLSVEAYRKIGDLVPSQKASVTIRQMLESTIYFKGNFYELLATIANAKK